MKVIIAGGRGIWLTQEQMANIVIESELCTNISEVVSGGAMGIDIAGEAWAYESNVRVKTFSADWNQYGRAAGPIRNRQMADYADALVLVWNGKSRGSMSMRREAQLAGLRIYEHIIKESSC
jgi:hypothetical protein